MCQPYKTQKIINKVNEFSEKNFIFNDNENTELVCVTR